MSGTTLDPVALAGIIGSSASALATVVLVFLTYRYVRLTSALVEEARASRVPTVFLDIELGDLPKLVIGNVGTAPAFKLRFEVLADVPWRSMGKGHVSGIKALAPIKQGISYLAPGRILKFFPGDIDDKSQFFSAVSVIRIRLHYDTESGRTITRDVSFGMGSYSGVAVESFSDPFREIARQIREAAHELRRQDDPLRAMNRLFKKACPTCGEQVMSSAKKCRFCMEPIPSEQGAPPAAG
jgi:hypothetical protein